MTLEQSLWADMIDLFENGTKAQWLAAQRRYLRFMEGRSK